LVAGVWWLTLGSPSGSLVLLLVLMVVPRRRMKRALTCFAILAAGLFLAAGPAWAQEKPVPPAAQDKAKAPGGDVISGEWEGAVEMPDGAMPFTLKLKFENDKVTGEVGSQQGAVAITEGSFVDGKLTVTFTYVDGNPVSMSGTLADGQLTGSLSYGGGQMVTNWAAKKKLAK